MDLAGTEQIFTAVVAAATLVTFWALWSAFAVPPPIEGRLGALHTRRMKTRSAQAGPAKPSPKATSLGFMRFLADRLNLLRGAAADQTTRKLRRAGFVSRDAAVVYIFIKLALPLALGFLLYVAPVRRQAGIVIWIAACVVGGVLLFAVYFFHWHAFQESLRRAAFWGATWRGFTILGVYKQVAAQIGRACPALSVALPVVVMTYAAWPRTRYFGNTAPLLVAVLFLLLGMAHPHVAGAGFLLAAVPFLFIFVSGVLADLLETRCRAFVMACVVGMLAAYVVWSVVNLAQVPQG